MGYWNNGMLEDWVWRSEICFYLDGPHQKMNYPAAGGFIRLRRTVPEKISFKPGLTLITYEAAFGKTFLMP